METTKKTQKVTHLVSGATPAGYGAWGSGTSQAKALTAFRRAGGDTSRAMYLYEFGPETTYRGIGAAGFLHYDGPEPVARRFTVE